MDTGTPRHREIDLGGELPDTNIGSGKKICWSAESSKCKVQPKDHDQPEKPSSESKRR